MSTAPDTFKGLERIVSKLEALASMPASEVNRLGVRMQEIMTEDNRKGVLQGQDKDGNPAPPLKYRTGSGSATRARSRTQTDSQKRGAFGSTTASFKGFGPMAGGLHGNLSTREYQELTGPRLAPRGEQSRSIANYGAVGAPRFDGNTLTVDMGWADIVSAKGIPFIGFHFAGAGRNPKYDLRGIRPWGKAEIRKSLREWVEFLISGTPLPWGGGY